MLTNPPDLCPCISVSHLLAMHLSLLVSVLNVKVLVGAFNQEKACEIFANLRFQLYWTLDSSEPDGDNQEEFLAGD